MQIRFIKNQIINIILDVQHFKQPPLDHQRNHLTKAKKKKQQLKIRTKRFMMRASHPLFSSTKEKKKREWERDRERKGSNAAYNTKFKWRRINWIIGSSKTLSYTYKRPHQWFNMLCVCVWVYIQANMIHTYTFISNIPFWSLIFPSPPIYSLLPEHNLFWKLLDQAFSASTHQFRLYKYIYIYIYIYKWNMIIQFNKLKTAQKP